MPESDLRADPLRRTVPDLRPLPAYRVRELAAESGLDPRDRAVRWLCGGGDRVRLLEAAIGMSVPDYPGRRRIARHVRGSDELRVVMFTDPAHTTFIWGWSERVPSTGAQRYREFHLPGRARDLQEALAMARSSDVVATPRGAPEVVTALVREITGKAVVPPPSAGLAILLDLIEEADQPATLRRFWQRITRLTVLDPDCGDGAWLLEVATLLETLFLAVIDRMRSFVDERRPCRRRRRADFLADFRATLAIMEDRLIHPSTVVAIRRRIVRTNLYALAANASDAARCCDRLLAYAHRSTVALPQLDTNVRLMTRRPVRPRRGGIDDRDVAKGYEPTDDPHLLEEIETLGAAWRAVRAHLDLPCTLDHELRRAAHGLDRRRSALSCALTKIAPAREAAGFPFPFLHLDFPGLPLDGAFRLTRKPG